MTQEQMRNLNTIVETYGNDAQEDMAIEECSELVKAILKLRRSDEKTAEMREAVIDEIADVQIMLSQLEIIFNCVAEVEDRIDFKINRQMGVNKQKKLAKQNTPLYKRVPTLNLVDNSDIKVTLVVICD